MYFVLDWGDERWNMVLYLDLNGTSCLDLVWYNAVR